MKKSLVRQDFRFCERLPYAFVILWAMNHGGLNAQQYGWLIAIEMTTAMLCYIPVAHLADKYGRRPFVLATFVFFTLFPVTLLWAHNFAWLAVAFVVRGLKEFGEPARKALIIARTLGWKLELADVRVSSLVPPHLASLTIPEFVARSWWERILYNQSARRLRSVLLGRPHTVVVDVPYRRDDPAAAAAIDDHLCRCSLCFCGGQCGQQHRAQAEAGGGGLLFSFSKLSCLIFCLRILPDLNLTTARSGMTTSVSGLLGLRPTRALRTCTSSTPKLRS